MRGKSGSANRLRKSVVALLLYGMGLAAFAWTGLDSRYPAADRVRAEALRVDLADDLELGDLTLFTEARYTRHLSQADLHSAFQDHPMSVDHFPSGSLVAPPVSRERGRP